MAVATNLVAQSSRKLILHWDVNETIMVGDPAGGDTFEDCLNKMIAKNAWIKPAATGDGERRSRWSEWTWHDGSPLDPDLRGGGVGGSSSAEGQPPPPLLTAFEGGPPGCVTVYRSPLRGELAKTFTNGGESPGVIYRPLYEALERALRVPNPAGEGLAGEGQDGDGDNAVDQRLIGPDGVHYLVMPAFFATLQALHDAGRPFATVIRTFGSDGPEVAAAVDAWREGRHPDFKGAPASGAPPFSQSLWEGRYDAGTGEFTLRRDPRGRSGGEGEDGGAGRGAGEGKADEKEGVNGRGGVKGTAGEDGGGEVLNEAAAFRLFDSADGLVVTDDYAWWRTHGYAPSAGKPLWLSPCAHARQLPLFFDDNIHNDAADSIVAVRTRPSPEAPFRALSGESIRQLQGIVLVRVPTFEPILDRDWFLKSIRDCEANFDEQFSTLEQQDKILLIP